MEAIHIYLAAFGVTIGAHVIASVVWGIRQEGRINAHTQLFGERKEQTDDKIEALCVLTQARHEELMGRLARIERKQDAANGRS